MENFNEICADTENGCLTRSSRRRNQRLAISPVAIQTARAFAAWTHRHLAPPPEAEIVLGVQTGNGTLVGVVFVSGWHCDDEATAEIVCLSTDSTPNACSALLGAARRAARAAGYRRLIARTRLAEPGTSLRAAGFRPIQLVGGRTASVVWEASAVGGRR
ncbi:XF1762 family protein [Nonomuraea sp. NPDC049607]|uniref:XF1762 family protein n=1 Tax=Nonomuraea sp. NPDC049607 TaxID=3154732 RepID=UPI003434AB97